MAELVGRSLTAVTDYRNRSAGYSAYIPTNLIPSPMGLFVIFRPRMFELVVLPG